MNRLLTLTLAVAAAATVEAQTNPLIAEAKQTYSGVKNNLTRLADKMPEDAYSFKPVPEIRNFAQEVAHVADAQARICGSVTGEVKNLNAAAKTSKADLVAALKESFGECDKAWDSISDATANEMIKGARPRAKLAVLVGNNVHDNEMYGAMAVYLRLKGIVPPSSEPK